MSDQILTARKGPILEITLNRPEIGNAASDAVRGESGYEWEMAGVTNCHIVNPPMHGPFLQAW